MALLEQDEPLFRTGPALDWAVAARSLGGERESGDGHVFVGIPNGALVAVIDGLGHGPEAARASRRAAAAIESNASEPPDEILRRCHQDLRQTRGAVVTLAAVSGRDETMNWLGVGNVTGVFFPNDRDCASTFAPARGGILGSNLPKLASAVVSLKRDDVIVLASDGLRPGFGLPIGRQLTVQSIADQLLAEHGDPRDDALVLVARYLGRT